jgi:hypothetical protein
MHKALFQLPVFVQELITEEKISALW